MPRLTARGEDRKLAIQLDIENQLHPLMASEAVEILARIMAHIVNRDTRQLPALTGQFREAFTAEHSYLAQCRARSRQDERTNQGGIS
jgi:hypothetical protein